MYQDQETGQACDAASSLRNSVACQCLLATAGDILANAARIHARHHLKASAHSPALAREPTISQTVEVIRASTKPIYPHIFAAKTVSNCARAQFAIGEKGWGDDRCVKRSSRSVEFPRGSQRVLAVSSSRGASGSKDSHTCASAACVYGNGSRSLKQVVSCVDQARCSETSAGS